VFRVSGEVAAAMNAQDGDWLVICEGASMIGADIPDGSRLVMRPLYRDGYEYEAEHGDVCLVQACTDDDDCFWTVKKWYWDENDVILRNGDKAVIGLRANTT